MNVKVETCFFDNIVFILGAGESLEEKAAEKIKTEVEKKLASYQDQETIILELFSFTEVLKGLFELIEKHKNGSVTFYINISSSTKVVSQAAYMAAALSDANIRLYYIKAEEYLSTQLLKFLQNKEDSDIKQFIKGLTEKEAVYLSKGATKIVEIPVLKMKRPSKSDFEILEILKAEGGEISSTAKLIRIMKKLGSKESIQITDRNRYSKRLKYLINQGFVTQDPQGVSKKLSLTDSGAAIAKIGDILK
ncbi:hypothetical protein BMS3Abin16_00664 [archaeon BMS3Abin16]|nr:hypothetical protein BMS3Abin16_00664 [archaeon BMS3Abin16]GBE55887.1 hypothetical protein BMS3Bbin16_00082 [archaeon BMS3Bbin16]